MKRRLGFVDRKIFFAMYNFAQKNKIVNIISNFIAEFSSKIFLIIYILMLSFLLIDRNIKIYFCIIVPFAALTVSIILRNIFRRPRPNKEINYKRSYSFPSNHSVSAFIIAFSYFYINTKLGIAAIVLATFTGISRIFTGLHYPFDVFAGFCISSIIFAVAMLII